MEKRDERAEELTDRYIAGILSETERTEWEQLIGRDPAVKEKAERLRYLSLQLDQHADLLRDMTEHPETLHVIIDKITESIETESQGYSPYFTETVSTCMQELHSRVNKVFYAALGRLLVLKIKYLDQFCSYLKSLEQVELSHALRCQILQYLNKWSRKSYVESYRRPVTNIPEDQVIRWLNDSDTYMYPLVQSPRRKIVVAIVNPCTAFPYDRVLTALWFNVNDHLHFICISSQRNGLDRAEDIWHELNHMNEQCFSAPSDIPWEQ